MSQFRLLAFLFVIASATLVSVQANPLYKVTNVSPNPTLTNEFYLTATNITTSINGTNVKVLIYMDDPPTGGGAPKQIPGPLIEANVGQTIICHFKNKLTNNFEGATVHWHGLELDNDSDGTAVTQDSIFNGQTYTYRFVIPRAGLFWYHSHMTPGTSTFGGMYGPIVIHDTNETALIAANVLPATNYTFPLVMSDISFTNGTVGKVVNGTNYSLNTLIQICENGVLTAPNPNRPVFCGAAGFPGDVFLCNGSVPIGMGTPCTPATNSTPVFYIGKNQRIRLQLFNASISRNCYLTVRYPCSNPTGNTNLYHIGGQGGLLDSAVLEGGVVGGYDFKYGKGMVNLGSGMRSDVMFYSSGNSGDVIQLVGNKPPAPWNTSGPLPTTYPVAFFVVTNGGNTNALLAAGSPILTAIGATNENLRLLNTNALVPPPNYSLGTQNSGIHFSNSIPINGISTGPTIGGFAATALDGNAGYGIWPSVPHPPTALWAKSGDVLQLAIVNNADAGGGGAAHPYHLHGFSMQPVSIYSANLQTNLYNFPNNQFLDTIDIMPEEALVFRIKLTDRPIIADSATGGPVTFATDAASGGNLGRWLMHCHIFLHGAIGMISELVVVPNKFIRLVGPQAGTNSVLLAAGSGVPWTATNRVPWLHLLSSSGTGNATVLFSYDANGGPPRIGTLDVGGATVEVTQAGTTYIQAPGPLTGLVTSGIVNPYGIGADSSGNVCFSDSANGAVKRWTRSSNTIFTIASGLSSPYGLAIDTLDNVYFTQFGSTLIRKYSDASGSSTLFANDTTGVAGLAVDGAGDIYIAVPGQHAVKHWDAATGTLTTYTTNGLISPFGVAVDTLGGLYASDVGDSSVKKLGFTVVILFGGPFFIPTWNTFISSNNLSNPYNVAVDDGGNVFVADYSHGAIKKWSAVNNTVSTVVSGLGAPTGVAVDATGNLFVSDWGSDIVRELPYAFVNPKPQFEPAEFTVDKLPGVLLPTQNLLPPFAPILTPSSAWLFYGGATTGVVTFAVVANPGSPRTGTITVLGTNITINQAGSYFALGTTNLLVGPNAGSNTVTAALVPASSNWLASVSTAWLHLPVTSGTGSTNILFTYDANPTTTRAGKLIINGKIVTITQAGSTYVQAPGPLTTLVGTGLAQPWGVTVDLLGDAIFSDTSHAAVKQWSPGLNSVSALITNGLGSPYSVAVDNGGNIYVADFTGQAIKKRRASDGVLATFVDDAPNTPAGVAVDLFTNVYWIGPADDAVKEWSASSSNVVTLVATNLNNPYGVAVDVAGGIYIGDTFNKAVKKWNPVTSSLTTLVALGLLSPRNVAVDGSGNVYLADSGLNSIFKWEAASGNLVTLASTGLNTPTGVSVDANQNVYLADYGNNAIKAIPYAFVDASSKLEPFTAGSDSLGGVLPANQNLTAPFAPFVSDPWLNITSVAGGVVNFNYAANTNTTARNAVITVLGKSVVVFQDGAPPVPVFTAINLLTNGVFQLSFTNGVRAGTYSVLFSTNLLVPLVSWPVIGTATNNGAGVWQFTDFGASNQTRFYRIRSP